MSRSNKAPRAASTYRAARRNTCLRGEVRGTWGPQHYSTRHGAQVRYVASPPVHPNKRDRTPSADWMRLHPLRSQRQIPIAKWLRFALSGMVRVAAAAR